MSGRRNMQLTNRKLVLDGYPSGSRIVHFKSPLIDRLVRLRTAETLLQRAKHLMDSIGNKTSMEDHDMLEAIAMASSSYYFSCYAKGSLSPQFDPKVVFKGKQEALERHKDWRKIRDKRFHHPEMVGRSLEAGIVIANTGTYLDVTVISMDMLIGPNVGWMQILYQLICTTLEFTGVACDECARSIEAAVAVISSEELKKLKEPKLQRPEYG
jgi:hypothetical protein